MYGSAGAASSMPAPGAERRIHVVQGEYHVTGDASVVLATILGSCVAACMRDPVAGIGGMNHFLLPSGASDGPAKGMQYGVHSMELLVNGLLQLGARRDRLEAHLFGGARMITGLTDVGLQNATFAEEFLRREGIAHRGGSLRGEQGRRVQFWPVQGRARQMAIVKDGGQVFAQEQRYKAPPPPADTGAVELF